MENKSLAKVSCTQRNRGEERETYMYELDRESHTYSMCMYGASYVICAHMHYVYMHSRAHMHI